MSPQNENGLSGIRLVWGFIVRGTVPDVEALKKIIESQPGIVLIYQRATGGRLRIIEEKFPDAEEGERPPEKREGGQR